VTVERPLFVKQNEADFGDRVIEGAHTDTHTHTTAHHSLDCYT